MSYHFIFCYYNASLHLPEGSPRSSHFDARYPGGYVRDEPAKRHVSMAEGGPAPQNAFKPHARCPPAQPDASPPTTIPTEAPQQAAPKLADQPPLPSAGLGPPQHLTVPAMANPRPPPGPATLPAYPPPAPAPVLPLQASSPITSVSRPLAPAPVPIENPAPNTFQPPAYVGAPPY